MVRSKGGVKSRKLQQLFERIGLDGRGRGIFSNVKVHSLSEVQQPRVLLRCRISCLRTSLSCDHTLRADYCCNRRHFFTTKKFSAVRKNSNTVGHQSMPSAGFSPSTRLREANRCPSSISSQLLRANTTNLFVTSGNKLCLYTHTDLGRREYFCLQRLPLPGAAATEKKQKHRGNRKYRRLPPSTAPPSSLISTARTDQKTWRGHPTAVARLS